MTRFGRIFAGGRRSDRPPPNDDAETDGGRETDGDPGGESARHADADGVAAAPPERDVPPPHLGAPPPTAALAGPPERDSGAGAGSMTGRVTRGISWSAMSSVTTQASRAVTAIILARLLTPEEFGLAAIVLIFSGLALVFTDVALGAGLVQRSRITEQDRSTVFWTSCAIGGGLTVLGVALSWPVAGFFGEPDLQMLLAVFSLTFLVNGLATTQATLLQRALDFRSLEIRVIASTLVGMVTAVVVAAAGGGAWAIVAQSLASTTLSTLLLWSFSRWRPHRVFSTRSLRELGAFGLGIFGARVTWFVNQNVDTVLIGRFLGSGPLGLYAIAFNLILFPVSRIAQPIEAVMFPAMSRIQDEPERFARGWLRGSRLVMALALPAMLGMIVVAPEFVTVILGDKWESAVPVLQLLAMVGVMQAVQQFSALSLQARGRAATILVFTVIAFAANVIAFVVGLPFGITGVAAAYLVSTAVVFLPFLLVCAREVGVSVWVYARALQGAIASSLLMAAVVLGTRLGLQHVGAPDAGILAICVAVGVLTYPAAVSVLDPATRREVVSILERLRGRGGSIDGDGTASSAVG